MTTTAPLPATNPLYARCIDASRRVRWEIERDVIRGRDFDFARKFLPDALARIEGFAFLPAAERRFVSQVQGRTYANMFALVERFVGPKMLETTRHHWLGDPAALEALVRFSDEELKHQALFRQLEAMMARGMPAGYRFAPPCDDVARAVLGKSTWAVLALICLIELVTLVHYRQSIEPDAEPSDLWKDVFLFHWKEESQHAILDELEWKDEHARLSAAQVEQGVDDLIALVAAVDGLLQLQAAADAEYVVRALPARAADTDRLRDAFLDAYRWQYIESGAANPRFTAILAGLLTQAQLQRIGAALASLRQEPVAA